MLIKPTWPAPGQTVKCWNQLGCLSQNLVKVLKKKVDQMLHVLAPNSTERKVLTIICSTEANLIKAKGVPVSFWTELQGNPSTELSLPGRDQDFSEWVVAVAKGHTRAGRASHLGVRGGPEKFEFFNAWNGKFYPFATEITRNKSSDGSCSMFFPIPKLTELPTNWGFFHRRWSVLAVGYCAPCQQCFFHQLVVDTCRSTRR